MSTPTADVTLDPTPPGKEPRTGSALSGPHRRRKKKDVAEDRQQASWLVRGALLVLCAAWVLPTFGLFISSLRSPRSIQDSGWWTSFANPTQFTLANYKEVLTAGDNALVTAFFNSVAVAVPATMIPILIAAFAAYAFSWMDFKGREFFFIMFVALLVVPLQVAFIPIVQLSTTASGSPAASSRSGWRTPASGCRWRSTCCATTSARCRGRSSSRHGWTVRATSPRSGD